MNDDFSGASAASHRRWSRRRAGGISRRQRVSPGNLFVRPCIKPSSDAAREALKHQDDAAMLNVVALISGEIDVTVLI